jgi:hypothetical protein
MQDPFLWLQEGEERSESYEERVVLVASHNNSGPAVFLGWDERNASMLHHLASYVQTVLDIRAAGRVEITSDTWDSLRQAIHKVMECRENDYDIPCLEDINPRTVKKLADFHVDNF